MQLFPTCLQAQLAALEKNGVIPVKTVKEKLVITSTDTETKYWPFSYLEHSMHTIQVMVETAKTLGTYQDNKDLTSKTNACFCTFNMDKGKNTMNGSVLC